MLYNLLDQPAVLKRDATERMKDKEANRAAALKFGREYFDGTREQGYGGYYDDGRWTKVARRIVGRYGIFTGDYFLDIGCAKGFLMKELSLLNIDAFGVDVSEYAKGRAPKSIASFIKLRDCRDLGFRDNAFLCSVSINVIHNLDLQGCKDAIKEMMRVTRGDKMFIQVDAYEKDKAAFDAWNLTAKTCLRPTEWVELFKEVGYTGDYFFTIVG